MKRVLKVVSLVFLCVIGAFGVMIGGMYLFGGFNEKIVYAQDLAFNQNQIVSSDRILLNITTNTPDVTRKDLKLASGGKLANIAPTILDLLGIEKPAEMNEESLIIK